MCKGTDCLLNGPYAEQPDRTDTAGTHTRWGNQQYLELWDFHVFKSVDCEFLYLKPSIFDGSYQSLFIEDGANMFLENVGIYVQVHMVLQSRRWTTER